MKYINKEFSLEESKDAFDTNVKFIDVRETDEYAQVRIPGAKLIPMSEMNNRFKEIPANEKVVVYCKTGERSSYLINILSQHGYKNLINLSGGIVAWYERGFPLDTESIDEIHKVA